MNKKKQLAKNTLIIFLGRACTYFISFLLLPLYTSYLTTKDYGIVDLIQTYVTLLVPIITLELEMSIFRYLVDARGNNKDTKKRVESNNLDLIYNYLENHIDENLDDEEDEVIIGVETTEKRVK